MTDHEDSDGNSSDSSYSKVDFYEVMNEVPENYKGKVDELNKILQDKNQDINRLKELAISDGGLVISLVRREAWKLILNLPSTDEQLYPLEIIKDHPEYHQVDMDVRRCLKRFPPGISYEKIGVLQKELIAIILSVIKENPDLKYYQGYHDVAVTFLIEVGQNEAYSIMKHLSSNHLKEFLKPTMEETSYLLLHVFPLIKKLNPELEKFIEKSGIGTIFALPWLISWFSHSLDQHSKVVRLFDYFLASPKEIILYVIAQLIYSRRHEVLNTECDMAGVHTVLSKIPESLNFEIILDEATKMHKEYDLSNVKDEVDKRVKQEAKLLKDQRDENAKRKKDRKFARDQEHQEQPAFNRAFRYVPIWIRPRMRFGLLFFGFSLAAGLWAVFKSNNN
ncbi:TBC1 domain family member 20 isoform X1 [Acyrthosiphon pisum]|uniref:Rab-GAP TBC domain-containing protein n=2 Tax=Acyrthosiphon pisum TaxID=7029 RepID=A0A8R2NND8_ACYPI|nr:TBC1 domain family member 20 isoform X1 [Acyrthosiphon pisum]XP_029341703.1 TBC1 domain family member 20 isoform X1 [Acyrthosiphon pisum]XP_029341704.1 TBC1 domain family member 20 isoform X1 [Acyrthosiphon pisum]|eukprot:XP_008178229.1 PREDICTED: TBC1 domain family member 20 isoform X1 [Acyrthosiphon pisum]